MECPSPCAVVTSPPQMLCREMAAALPVTPPAYPITARSRTAQTSLNCVARAVNVVCGDVRLASVSTFVMSAAVNRREPGKLSRAHANRATRPRSPSSVGCGDLCIVRHGCLNCQMYSFVFATTQKKSVIHPARAKVPAGRALSDDLCHRAHSNVTEWSAGCPPPPTPAPLPHHTVTAGYFWSPVTLEPLVGGGHGDCRERYPPWASRKAAGGDTGWA